MEESDVELPRRGLKNKVLPSAASDAGYSSVITAHRPVDEKKPSENDEEASTNYSSCTYYGIKSLGIISFKSATTVRYQPQGKESKT